MGWEDKAHRVIAQLCLQSYEHTNTNKAGKRYKTHRPYSVPRDAEFLIDCLNRNDEHAAKAKFIELAYRNDN